MELIPFSYGDAQVRVVQVDGEPWFVASDVAKILGYREAFNMTRRMDDEDKGPRSVRTPGGEQQMTCISEAGLYVAVLGSQVEGARSFKRWITHEVLPQIRKTGSYGGTVDLTGPELMAKALIEASETLKAKDQRIAELEPPAAAWQHLASTADDYSVQQAATILARDPSIRIGRQRLFAWMDGSGWTYRDRGTRARMAYQRAIESGRLAHRAQHHIHPRSGEVVLDPPQIRVTVKGLTDLHRALGGSAPLSIEGHLPELEAIS